MLPCKIGDRLCRCTVSRAGVAAESELAESKTKLAGLNGHLEKLQMQQIDSVVTADLNSGQALARVRRKGLNSEVETATERCAKLHAKATEALRSL